MGRGFEQIGPHPLLFVHVTAWLSVQGSGANWRVKADKMRNQYPPDGWPNLGLLQNIRSLRTCYPQESQSMPLKLALNVHHSTEESCNSRSTCQIISVSPLTCHIPILAGVSLSIQPSPKAALLRQKTPDSKKKKKKVPNVEERARCGLGQEKQPVGEHNGGWVQDGRARKKSKEGNSSRGVSEEIEAGTVSGSKTTIGHNASLESLTCETGVIKSQRVSKIRPPPQQKRVRGKTEL